MNYYDYAKQICAFIDTSRKLQSTLHKLDTSEIQGITLK